MDFNHLSPNIIKVYIQFFDSLLQQAKESKNYENYKLFKKDAEFYYNLRKGV